MDTRRIAPVGFTQTKKNKAASFIPALIFVWIIINGLFNFTSVNEVFIISTIVAGALVVCMVFMSRYRSSAGMSDPLSLSVLAWSLLVCVSVLWAVNPSVAFFYLVGYGGSLFLFCIVRSFILSHDGDATRILRMIACGGAVVSLISIEMASTGLFKTLYFDVFAPIFRFSADTASYGGWVEGARMQSIMGLPNLYATFSAMCFFVGLSLVTGSKGLKAVDLGCLIINGTGFFLSGSRGGYIAFAVAFLLSVVFQKKENRRRDFFLSVLLILWSAGSAVLLMKWMGDESLVIWPVFGILLYAAVLLRRPIEALLSKLAALTTKLILMILGAVVLAALVFVIVALNIKTAFPLYEDDAKLTRAVTLSPGKYTLDVNAHLWDENEVPGLSVSVTSASVQQAAARDFTILAEKTFWSNGSVSFTVPQDAAAVTLTLQNVNGKASVTELTIHGQDKEIKVPLQYNLLPESIVSRLQGMSADANTLQRFVYWQDGLRIFAQSPILGQGGGAFETLSSGVSDYYYFTKHAHNHYIQVLLENGVLGLIALLATLIFCVCALWRSRSTNTYTPFLASAAGMMFIHSITEASMQNLLNLNIFFLLLGVIASLTKQPEKRRTAELIKAVACVMAVAIVGMLAGRIVTQPFVKAAEHKGTREALDAYRWAVVTDPLNAFQYRTACLTRYLADPTSGAADLSNQFVSNMEANWNTPRDCFIVGRYHLQSDNGEKATKYFERYIELCRTDSRVWDAVLAQYIKAIKNDEFLPEIQASMQRLDAKLIEINEKALIPVEPNAGLLKIVKKALEPNP